MIVPLDLIGLIISLIGTLLLYYFEIKITINVVGLIFSLVGAVFLIIPLLKTDSQIETSSACLGMVFGDLSEKNASKQFKKDRNCGIIGLLFLIIGFILQIVGSL